MQGGWEGQKLLRFAKLQKDNIIYAKIIFYTQK